MKTIFIVRHGKSSWDFPELSDKKRPLLKKGINRTKKIGKYLSDNNIKVDLIISSPAVRAFETARIIAKEINYPKEKIEINNSIYESNEENILVIIESLPNEINSIMIFGHNPAFTYFSNYFLEDKLDWLPTSGTVSISFQTDDWMKIVSAKRKINFVLTKRSFNNN
ncbi:MAG: histidine phosphatase family protein [Bacteroidales bacterium]|nr:histidine phosphatase family protein [Bacteroidales bacterium]